jgi:hypothetical protein
MSQLAAILKPVLVAHSTSGATSEPGGAMEARAASEKRGEEDVMPFSTEEPAEIHTGPA